MEEYTMDSIGPLLLWLVFFMAAAELTLRPARKALSGPRAVFGVLQVKGETSRREVA
jgi:hypothetical protein